MAESQDPFADVVLVEDGFSIPELKWRELVFIRALVPETRFLRARLRAPAASVCGAGTLPRGRPLPRRADGGAGGGHEN